MTPRRRLPSSLGPWCVGVRVVVRRRIPGQEGPTGGPAMTDLLGVMLEWGDTTITVQPEDGPPVVIERSLIVSGKPVPPRPSVRLRVDPEDAQLRAAASWPAVDSQRLGDWLLRASAGYSARGNSALLVGRPDRPVEEALQEVRRFYAERRLPAWVQVIVGSETHQRLEDAGWGPARSGEADTLFQLHGVAVARRAVRRSAEGVAEHPAVRVRPELDSTWLADDPRAGSAPEAARAVLEGPDSVAFATIGDDPVLARGRAAVTGEAEPWAGITAVSVDPAHRRRGLGLAVMGALLDWAAEQGAGTAYLQVLADNHAALTLYERLGFVTHHAYRYLQAP